MIIMMIVVMIVMRFGPVAVDKHVTSVPFLPAWRNPDRSAMGRKLPMAGHPLMSSVVVRPIACHPYMIARGPFTLDYYFVSRCRWRSEVNIHVNCRNQARRGGERAAGCEWRKDACRDQYRQTMAEKGFSGCGFNRGHDINGPKRISVVQLFSNQVNAEPRPISAACSDYSRI